MACQINWSVCCLKSVNKKLSYCKGTARRARLKFCQLLLNCMKITFEKGLQATQCRRKWRGSIGNNNFLLVVSSNSVSILHRFKDIATFIAYMTGCDIEKFRFDTTTADTYAFRFVYRVRQ